jgi:hypothetical protein
MNFVRAAAVITAVGLTLGADWTAAQEAPGDDLDITMTLMPEGSERPDAVTRELTLPVFPEGDEAAGEPIPSEQGVANSANGLDIANQARADGRAFGQAAAEAAQENREDLGRGSRPDDLPGPPDDLPGPPDNLPSQPEDLPGPPDNVPGPPDNLPGPP